jgi:hypothetical protein
MNKKISHVHRAVARRDIINIPQTEKHASVSYQFLQILSELKSVLAAGRSAAL